MADVFLSHSKEDSQITLQLALDLEQAGFSTWCMEADPVPGPSYVLQTFNAINRAKVVVLFISRSSVRSRQVTLEVIRAHESNKEFVPLLVDLTHPEFCERQPEWREVLGASTSLPIPPSGVSSIAPEVEAGLRALGVAPNSEKNALKIGRIMAQLNRAGAARPLRAEDDSNAPRPAPPGPGPAHGDIRLVVRDGEAERTYGFQARRTSRIVIGRRELSDIRIDCDLASQVHAMIVRSSSGEWELKDAWSKNGTLLNGRLVQDAMLNENDVITVGSCTILVLYPQSGLPGAQAGGRESDPLAMRARPARSAGEPERQTGRGDVDRAPERRSPQADLGGSPTIRLTRDDRTIETRRSEARAGGDAPGGPRPPDEISPGDARALRGWYTCFDQPAFRDRFESESNLAALMHALDDTIEAINSGVRRQNGVIIGEPVPGKAYLKSEYLRDMMDRVVLLLGQARLLYARARRAGWLFDKGPSVQTFHRDHQREAADAAAQIDELRNEALAVVNQVFGRIGMRPLPYIQTTTR